MHTHEIDYEILGGDMQVVSIELDPGETVIAEAGSMNWMDPGILFEAKMGDGSNPNEGFFGKMLQAGSRLLTGEQLFLTHFTNQGVGKKQVAFAAPYPGTIQAMNLSKFQGSLLCQRDAFLCAAKGTKVSVAFTKKLGAGFFGGEGFILQKLEGSGWAFLHAGGTVIEKELHGGEILVDTGCLVAFDSTLEYTIERAGSMRSMLFGGEGLFLAKLRGTGTVYLQSLPFSRLAHRVLRYAPQAGGHKKGEGSILGGLGNLLDGDNF